MNAASTSMDEALAFRERERAFPPTQVSVPRVRRCVAETRRSVDRDAASRHRSSTSGSANATVSSMDVSHTCIERNRACTEQMPHVTRTESCVHVNAGLRAPSQPLRTRNASLRLSVEELRQGKPTTNYEPPTTN